VVGIPTAPLVISVLITPMMEANLRRALIIGRGDWIQALFGSPLSIGLVVATAVLTFISLKLKAAEVMGGGGEETEKNSQ